MSDRVLLTDQRENVLNGQYDGSETALRNQKSRLRRSSRTALQELTTVAESPHIDQTEVFDPDDVFYLLRALLTATPDHIDGEGTALFQPPTGDTDAEYTDEFEAYRNRLQVQLAKLVLEDTTDL